MKPFHYRILFLCIAVSSISVKGFTQNMSSPYSVYGIGDIDWRTYNHNTGMGYTGLGLKTSLITSGNNPASNIGIDKSFFIVSANGTGKTVTYVGDQIDASNSNNKDFTIKKLSITSKITSFWASGVGFRQFSNVSYQFQNSKAIESSNNTYTVNYSGDGGLNEYYWNNAFAIGKHLAVGVTSSFLSGPVNQTETIVSDANTIQSTRRDYYANAKFDYGLLYTIGLNKKWNVGVGARYMNQTKINYERSLNVLNGTTTLLNQDYLNYNNFSLPASYGAGLSLVNKRGTRTFAADYTHEDWASLHTKGDGWQLVNSNRISVGAEFASFVNALNKNALKKSFQFGAFMNNSYLQVKGHQIAEYGVTGGITRSLKNGLLYSFSLEGGTRGTIQSGLIKENFAQLSLTLSYRDFLFSKGHLYN